MSNYNAADAGVGFTRARASAPGSPRKPVTSVSPKPVKSASPKHNVVGKLNFLQNDNIDDQFVQLFDSHEDIKQILYSIEHQSKQTSLDLSQLFERSKSNNSHLNKLLDGISAHSIELAEERSAAKTAALRLPQMFDQIQASVKEYAANQDKHNQDALQELRTLFNEALNRQAMAEKASASSYVNKRDDEMEARLSHVSDLVRQTSQESSSEIRKSMAQALTQWKQEMADDVADRISRLLENKKEEEDGVRGIQKKLGGLELSDDISALQARKAELVASNHDLELRNSALSQQHTKMEAELASLSNQYTQMRSNYSDLNDKYEAKLKLCEHIRAEFSILQQEAQQFEARMKNLDTRIPDTVQNLHAKKVQQLRVATPLLDHKRVSSMPHRAQDREYANNSDLDE